MQMSKQFKDEPQKMEVEQNPSTFITKLGN